MKYRVSLLHSSLVRLVFAVAVFAVCPATLIFAQESNVLGLPAVPQAKAGSTPAAAKGAQTSSPKTGSSTAATPANRDVLAGELGIQHSVVDGLGRIVFTTRGTFATAGAASNATDVARAVQRELVLSCGKQCKPQKMAAPKILSSGQLEFEVAFRPIYQHLNQAQFLAVLQSKPLNLTPAQLAAPVATPPAAPVATPAVVSQTTTATQ